MLTNILMRFISYLCSAGYVINEWLFNGDYWVNFLITN